MDKKRVWLIVLNLMIVVSWLVVLVDSVLQGLEFPGQLAAFKMPTLPLWLVLSVTLLLPISASVLTFWRRENVMEHIPWVTDWLDRIVFQGAYEYFMNRMYPVHASVVSSVLFGGVSCWVTYEQGATLESSADWLFLSYMVSAVCFLFAVTMLYAVVVSRRYPPVLK